jgi:WD40 repeat protein
MSSRLDVLSCLNLTEIL